MIHPLSDNASCLTNYQWPPLVISQSGILTLCEWTCSSPPRTSGVVSPWYWTQSWTRCLQCVAECSPLACYVPVYQTEHLIIYNIRFISIIILSMFLTPYFSKLLNRICYVLRIMKERKKRYAGINSVLNLITLLLLWTTYIILSYENSTFSCTFHAYQQQMEWTSLGQ